MDNNLIPPYIKNRSLDLLNDISKEMLQRISLKNTFCHDFNAYPQEALPLLMEHYGLSELICQYKNPKELRQLLQKFHEIHCHRGTKGGLLHVLKLLGVEATVTEAHTDPTQRLKPHTFRLNVSFERQLAPGHLQNIPHPSETLPPKKEFLITAKTFEKLNIILDKCIRYSQHYTYATQFNIRIQQHFSLILRIKKKHKLLPPSLQNNHRTINL